MPTLALFAAGRMLTVRPVLAAHVAGALNLDGSDGQRWLTFWFHRFAPNARRCTPSGKITRRSLPLTARIDLP